MFLSFCAILSRFEVPSISNHEAKFSTKLSQKLSPSGSQKISSAKKTSFRKSQFSSTVRKILSRQVDTKTLSAFGESPFKAAWIYIEIFWKNYANLLMNISRKCITSTKNGDFVNS
jgi:hypothetical protein